MKLVTKATDQLLTSNTNCACLHTVCLIYILTYYEKLFYRVTTQKLVKEINTNKLENYTLKITENQNPKVPENHAQTHPENYNLKKSQKIRTQKHHKIAPQKTKKS